MGVAECRYELPSSRSGAKPSPALLPGEKGAGILVPSPWGEGQGEGGEGLRQENHISIQQRPIYLWQPITLQQFALSYECSWFF